MLGASCLAVIAVAAISVGPASSQSGATRRTATVQRGVVQSTVSGSGNLQPASELDLGFKASGTVQAIYVHEGEQVTPGQLLATLDPSSAEATLQQQHASLAAAEATLKQLEESGGESGASGAGSGSGSGTTSAKAAGTTTYAPVTTTVPTTTPTKATTTPSNSTTAPAQTTSAPAQTTTAPAKTEATKETQSAATREANLASARAAVSSAKVSVRSAEQALAGTKLYAPSSGTIVSLSGQVGEAVSATGTTKASSAGAAGSTSSSSGASSGGGTAGGGASGASSSGASSAGGSSSKSFAVLSDLAQMQVVVPLSESEVGHVKNGQIATVTLEPLASRKLASHVTKIANSATSSSGVVSYDVTFALDQTTSGEKAGMSATAEVVIAQAEGLNVPSSAITAGSVTVRRNGKQERRSVTTGLAGNSTTIVTSGLEAGEQVLLPAAAGGSSSASNVLSRLGSNRGGGTIGGGGGGFPGGGFAGGGGPAGGALRGGG